MKNIFKIWRSAPPEVQKKCDDLVKNIDTAHYCNGFDLGVYHALKEIGWIDKDHYDHEFYYGYLCGRNCGDTINDDRPEIREILSTI